MGPSIRELIAGVWDEMSSWQKICGVVCATAVLAFVIYGVVDSVSLRFQLHELEQEKKEALAEAQMKLEAAAKIAADIQVRETELKKVEEKRDEAEKKVSAAANRVRSDRAEYDRAVRERRKDVPSTDQLCAELGALGYPCR